jgi:hypothetical protein
VLPARSDCPFGTFAGVARQVWGRALVDQVGDATWGICPTGSASFEVLLWLCKSVAASTLVEGTRALAIGDDGGASGVVATAVAAIGLAAVATFAPGTTSCCRCAWGAVPSSLDGVSVACATGFSRVCARPLAC